MATITSNVYLDDATRTAGEAWTINGGILTIHTDTRWHTNAPASMLGSIASTTISATLGGGILVDSTAVRWMPYNNGGGSVPSIGTAITQNGVTGYLLGVWADYTSAPSTVGAAMPVSGYLKFREVTNGPFTVGALTGISADAAAPDRQGWIEVVQDQAAANTIPRLGFFKTRGGWFELDQVTSGSANDIIQIPTNGGGANTYVPAVWIETGNNTNEYEMYPAIANTWFLAANLGTDDRCKFVRTIGNGQVVLGHDGTANAGFVPPSGCRIRIPSNIGRQTSSANRSLNLAPHGTIASRPDFTTTSAGAIDFEYFMNDWYHLFTAPYSVRILHSATFDSHSTSNEASPTYLEDYCAGNYITGQSFTATNNSLGGTLKDLRFTRPDAASNGHSWVMTGCSNYNLEGLIRTGIIAYARSTGIISFSQCRNFVQTGVLSSVAATVTISTCSNFNLERIRYIDRYTGTTNSTTGKYAIATAVSSDNVIIRNVDFGGYPNLHPYSGLYNSSNCSNITIRNAGSFASPLGGSTNAPAVVFLDSGNNDGIKLQNLFLTATRTTTATLVNTSKNITLERVQGTTGAIQTLSLNTLVKGNRATSNSTTGGASVYGTHSFDMFGSDTTGFIWWAMNEPTAFSSSYCSLTLTGPNGGFTSGGQVSMPNVGDVLISEFPYYILGHTGFVNTAPTLTGTNTGNFSYEYQIDRGLGYLEDYKVLNATNLSGESISSTDGFKIRLKITCITASTTNALTYVRINTTSSTAAQDFSYPLDTAKLTFIGLSDNSEVRCYVGTDPTTAVDLGGIEHSAGGTFMLTHSLSNSEIGYVQIFALGYQPISLPVTYHAYDETIMVQQIIDRVYVNA